MPRADDDNMVKAFPPDRANQPFRMSIPPWRAGRGWIASSAAVATSVSIWLTRPASGIEFTIRTARSRIHCRADTLAQVLRVSSPHQGSPIESRRKGITNSAAPESSGDPSTMKTPLYFPRPSVSLETAGAIGCLFFSGDFPRPPASLP
jgi:hypothetical protein